MDHDQIVAALHAAIGEILEVTAFELAEPCEVTRIPDGAVGATIVFRGPPSGRLRLWIEPAQVEAFAAAVLDITPVSPELANDTVAELANMVAGHVLGRLWASTCVSLDHAVVGAPTGTTWDVTVRGDHGQLGAAFDFEAG